MMLKNFGFWRPKSVRPCMLSSPARPCLVPKKFCMMHTYTEVSEVQYDHDACISIPCQQAVVSEQCTLRLSSALVLLRTHAQSQSGVSRADGPCCACLLGSQLASDARRWARQRSHGSCLVASIFRSSSRSQTSN